MVNPFVPFAHDRPGRRNGRLAALMKHIKLLGAVCHLLISDALLLPSHHSSVDQDEKWASSSLLVGLLNMPGLGCPLPTLEIASM